MWSNERKNRITGNTMTMTIRGRFTEMALGTQPGDEDIYRQFIASKAPDALSTEEEIALSGVDEVMDRKITVFPMGKFFKTPDDVFYDTLSKKNPIPMDEDGWPLNEDGSRMEGEFVTVPFMWDYQFKGACKEAIQMLSRASKKKAGKTKKEDEDSSEVAEEIAEEKPKKRGRPKKKSIEDEIADKLPVANFAAAKITAFKKVVDGTWFLKERRIPLLVPEEWTDELGNTHPTWKVGPDGQRRLNTYSRPLRADGPTGSRTALACSEFVPAGTEFYFTIELLNPSDKEALLEVLDYKMIFGMLQWRGGGKGTMIWTPADKNGKPIDD